jgi:hypothetical protein
MRDSAVARVFVLTSIEDLTGIEVKSSAGDPVWLPVEAFLDKPVAPETLLGVVRNLLESPKKGTTV